MSILMNGFHPSFDALSAYADQSDLGGGGTRTGRHVSTCADCAATVAEIRALGDAARGVEVPGVPAGLWTRIELATSVSAPAAGRAILWPDAESGWRSAPPPQPLLIARADILPRGRGMRASLALIAAAVFVLGILVVTPGSSPLLATAAMRMSFTPFRPAPGARVQVRYRPTPQMQRYDRLVLAGSFLNASLADYDGAGLYDSLTTLHRGPDGSMIGEITMPVDFRAVWLIVQVPGGPADDDNGFPWFLVGGDASGKPVLSSLLSALSFSGYSPTARQLLDTLQRYFPDHPAGFATAPRYDGGGVFSDLVALFAGAERKYASFDAKLEKRSRLSADEIVAMINFAYSIQEPGEAAKWTERLVREHPDDAHAVGVFATMLHEMELRSAPVDSIRRLMPRLDSLGARAPAHSSAPSSRLIVPGRYGPNTVTRAQELVRRYGAAGMQQRWALLLARDERFREFPMTQVEDRWMANAEIEQTVKHNLRLATSSSCVIPPGHVARPRWNLDWTANCTRRRALAFAELSRISLLQHQPVAAHAYADSAVAIENADGGCNGRLGYRRLGSALLVVGDTAGAARAFAKSMYFNVGRSRAERDSIRRLVAPVTDSATFMSLIASAEADGRACQLVWSERRRASARR